MRLRAGHFSVTDGPFAGTKEHLAGNCLIEACDRNDAIRLISRLPSARFGSIEVHTQREALYIAPDATAEMKWAK